MGSPVNTLEKFQQQSYSHGRVQKQGSLLCIFYFCLFNRFERHEQAGRVNSWISIDEQFPEDKYPVLCSSSIYGKVVLCWDELSQTWNYPESNEFYCDWDKVDCWMLIPEV